MVSRLDPDQRGAVGLTDTIGRSQSLTVISESGFYDVVVRSDKPQGKGVAQADTPGGTQAKRGSIEWRPLAEASPCWPSPPGWCIPCGQDLSGLALDLHQGQQSSGNFPGLLVISAVNFPPHQFA